MESGSPSDEPPTDRRVRLRKAAKAAAGPRGIVKTIPVEFIDEMGD